MVSCRDQAADPPDASRVTRDLTLQTEDGVRIASTLYPVVRDRPAALVLVHALGSDRASWSLFASRAQRAGYMCIAIDVRGHGDSTMHNDKRISYREFNTADWMAALYDIRAAKAMLLDRGADPDNVAVVGASIGANLALQYAARDPEIQAVVMLSPGLTYKGVDSLDAIRAYGKRPSMLVTAKGDSYSASSCATLKSAAPGFCELREYSGSAHGTDVFAAFPLSVSQVLMWLDSIIGPEAAAANRARTKDSAISNDLP
jgi:pimeloyl-ACP methyl ester carboxylesterase